VLKSKEHYDLIEMFERDFSRQPSFRGRFDKEEKALWTGGHIYQDGATNTLFLAYRLGYAYGKVVGR
jgi:hypothetical protein